MNIQFFGAAQEVTGSKHLLEISGKKILLDCGLFQGKRLEAYEKNRKFPFDPSTVDVMVLSHAHLDHCGNLPTLTKNGFVGKIFCTEATADIVPLMLMDSAHIQEADEAFVKKHIENPGVPTEPLYTEKDVPAVVQKLVGKPYHEKFEILPNVWVQFYDAGHILGSATVEITYTEEDGVEKILVFTGDLGRKNKNLLNDPETPPKADFVITESTYGNRIHEPDDSMRDGLEKIINETAERGGKIIVPAFSLQRTQEFVYDLHILMKEGKVPKIPVFVDSPLAINVSDIYRKHAKGFDEKTYMDFFMHGETPLEFENLKYTRSVEESKALKFLRGPAIIVAASGMCEGGRIRHHLMNELEDEKNTILFVGYQAEYTLGRKILERRPTVRIFDQFFRVRADIQKLNGYSGHADSSELLSFFEKIEGVRGIFVVHGETSQSYEFANKLRAMPNQKWLVEIPEPSQSVDPEFMCRE